MTVTIGPVEIGIGVALLLSVAGYAVRWARRAGRVVRAMNAVVQKELNPNSGSSMKDGVGAIAVAVGELQRDMKGVKNDLYHHLAERTPKTE